MAVITQDAYDLQPHSAKCDARMAQLEGEVVDLRAEVAALKDAMRKMGITISKLGDAIGNFNAQIEGDWHLNE